MGSMSIKKKMSLAAPRWINWVRTLIARFPSKDQFLIEDDELTKLLKGRGLYEDLLNGKLRCSQCGTPLSKENLSGFVVGGGDYHFLCDDQVCLRVKKQP